MNCIVLHRLGKRLHNRKIFMLARLCDMLIFFLYNSYVPSSCSIGERTVFAYKGIGCVIHKNSHIGCDCIIGQNVTIGGNFHSNGVPIIGDNVFIGPGSRILGKIIIGDNSIIGANSVVLTDVPDGSVFAGVPARIIRDNKFNALIDMV